MGIEGRKTLRNSIAAAAALASAHATEAADVRIPDFAEGMRTKAADTLERKKAVEVVEVSSNKLTAEEVVRDRDRAIDDLLSELPPGASLSHLRDRNLLEAESQAYVPEIAEREHVLNQSVKQLKEFADALSPKENGLFALADVGDDGAERHRLYVLTKQENGSLQFVKAYRVSMSRNGFGNEKDSGKTPIGLMHVQYAHKGLLGEVVPAEQNHADLYKTRIGKERRPFVRDFGDFPFMEPAAVVTDRYTINAERGIHWHGTNRSGRWRIRDGEKVWQTYLGDEGQSGACGRMSNVDVRDMEQYVHPAVYSGNKMLKKGSPVYIHATEEVMRLHE